MAKITSVPGIGPRAAEALASHGITTVVELANSPVGRITGVRGFGPARAAAVKEAATALLTQSGAASKPTRSSPKETVDKAKSEGKKEKKKDKKKKKKKKDKKKDRKKKKDKDKKKKKEKGKKNKK